MILSLSDLSLDFFGPIEVRYDGEEIDITTRKALALLAYLAVTERAQSRQRLASLLWPEADQQRARTNLRGALWTLNQTPLERWVEATDEAVELRREDVDIDVVRFETLVKRDDEIRALARRQIAIDNLRESAYRQLFLALAGNGQRAVALKEYEGLRALRTKN